MLVYTTDQTAGIIRKGAGRGFFYIDPKGNKIEDAEVLQRIQSLAIPPAYSDVWICPQPNGHLQATGRDKRKRKQYRYATCRKHYVHPKILTAYEKSGSAGFSRLKIKDRPELQQSESLLLRLLVG